MRIAIALLVVVVIPALSAQPVAPTRAVRVEGVRLVRPDGAPSSALDAPFSPASRQRPDRPALYHVGVGLDGAIFALGAGMTTAGVLALARDRDGFNALPGTFAVVVGGTLAVLSGVDLIHVARGGDPVLVRAGERRPPPRRGPLR